MLKNKLSTACSAFALMFLCSTSAIAQQSTTGQQQQGTSQQQKTKESGQQEETFGQPVEKLTGRVGDIPVYSHIYGADFMTEQERCNYLLKLDSMQTKEERDAFRARHHQEIDQRRLEKGG